MIHGVALKASQKGLQQHYLTLFVASNGIPLGEQKKNEFNNVLRTHAPTLPSLNTSKYLEVRTCAGTTSSDLGAPPAT